MSFQYKGNIAFMAMTSSWAIVSQKLKKVMSGGNARSSLISLLYMGLTLIRRHAWMSF